MKCTLITGPWGSGKTSLAKWIAKPFPARETCTFTAIETDSDFAKFTLTVQSSILPQCRLILVNATGNVSLLKNWLRLTRQDHLLSNKLLMVSKIIRPEIVLIFRADDPVSTFLKTNETRGIKVIDLTKNMQIIY